MKRRNFNTLLGGAAGRELSWSDDRSWHRTELPATPTEVRRSSGHGAIVALGLFMAQLGPAAPFELGPQRVPKRTIDQSLPTNLNS